jgi:hypothetical protein
MHFLSDLLRNALVLPDYRDWAISREIIKARLQLLSIFAVLGLGGAFFSIGLFVLALSPALGLAIALGFDLFFAGGIEGGRRIRRRIVGAERVEAKRLETLAKLDYSGDLLAPSFIHGLHAGLWLEVQVLEKIMGKRIAPSMAMELGQAKTENNKRWIASANLARVTRAIEPLGQQFFSIWLEKTALPYWSNLEQEALASLPLSRQ